LELYHERQLSCFIPEVKYAKEFANDPLNHRRFLVISSAQDAMKPSDDIYPAAVELLKTYPYEDLLARASKKQGRINYIAGKYFGLTEGREEGKTLKSSLLFIARHDGDPINVFSDTTDFDVVRKRLMGENDGVYGVGRNIATLIAKNFVRF